MRKIKSESMKITIYKSYNDYITHDFPPHYLTILNKHVIMKYKMAYYKLYRQGDDRI